MTLLRDKPNHDAYLFCSVESAYDSSRPGADEGDQAPVMFIIMLPSGLVPTCTARREVNQPSKERLVSFDALGYAWVRLADPSFKGRVYNLHLSAIPENENDAQLHQHSSLFVITPREIEKDARGLCTAEIDYVIDYVDHVLFRFVGQEGEEIIGEWNRFEDPPIQRHMDDLVQRWFDFENSETGKIQVKQVIARARAGIEQVSMQLSFLFD